MVNCRSFCDAGEIKKPFTGVYVSTDRSGMTDAQSSDDLEWKHECNKTKIDEPS